MNHDERERPQRAKKDRRRWCRGKVGVEHLPECRDYRDVKRAGFPYPLFEGWKVLVCKTCGKELAWWAPPIGGGLLGGRQKRTPPDWVK